MAVELLQVLVAVHRAAANDSVRIVAAKLSFCGAVRPINDFHAAMAAAVARNWLAYSDDFLSIRITEAGYSIAAPNPAPRRAVG